MRFSLLYKTVGSAEIFRQWYSLCSLYPDRITPAWINSRMFIMDDYVKEKIVKKQKPGEIIGFHRMLSDLHESSKVSTKAPFRPKASHSFLKGELKRILVPNPHAIAPDLKPIPDNVYGTLQFGKRDVVDKNTHYQEYRNISGFTLNPNTVWVAEVPDFPDDIFQKVRSNNPRSGYSNNFGRILFARGSGIIKNPDDFSDTLNLEFMSFSDEMMIRYTDFETGKPKFGTFYELTVDMDFFDLVAPTEEQFIWASNAGLSANDIIEICEVSPNIDNREFVRLCKEVLSAI